MSVRFPLGDGADGWHPGDEKCLVCGASLAAPPQRIRIFIGTSGSMPIGRADGVFLDFHWYGPEQPGRNDTGLRTVRVFGDNDDDEKVLEFCSTTCLRTFFNAIADLLD